MITVFSIYAGGKRIAECYGLSTDEKPLDVANASRFYEMDSKKFFLFDAENKLWLEQ